MRLCIVIVVLFVLSCGPGKASPPVGVDKSIYSSYMKMYITEWKDGKQINEKVKNIAKKIIGSCFVVAFEGDIDADGVFDYLIIRKAKKYFHAVHKAVLIDAKGKIKLILDKNRGVYRVRNSFLNSASELLSSNNIVYILKFDNIGVRKGDIQCIRLLFNKNSLTFDHKMHEKFINDYAITGKRKVVYGSMICFELIDKEGALIGIDDYWGKRKEGPYRGYYSIAKNHYISKDRVDVEFSISIGPDSVKAVITSLRVKMLMYYKNKKKGYLVKAINVFP